MDIPSSLVEQIDTYQRPHEATRFIQGLPGVRLLGPFGIGKTSLIHEITRLDSDFDRIRGFSSRELRNEEVYLAPHELPHRTIHTKQDWQEIGDRLTVGTIAHIIRHPRTGHIMGSTMDEYSPGRYPIIDLSYKAVQTLPFTVDPIMITATPEDWQRWSSERAGLRDFSARKADAIDCLTWGLDNHVAWIVNTEGGLERAAKEIIDFAKEGRTPDSANRTHGKALLQAIQAL